MQGVERASRQFSGETTWRRWIVGFLAKKDVIGNARAVGGNLKKGHAVRKFVEGPQGIRAKFLRKEDSEPKKKQKLLTVNLVFLGRDYCGRATIGGLGMPQCKRRRGSSSNYSCDIGGMFVNQHKCTL